MKVYGFWNSNKYRGDAQAVALDEEGNIVGSWICSSEGFARGDLLRCEGAEDWDFEYVPMEDRDTHEGLQAAITANSELALAEAQAD